jgi:hypothetical protein
MTLACLPLPVATLKPVSVRSRKMVAASVVLAGVFGSIGMMGSERAHAQEFGTLLDSDIPFDLRDEEQVSVLERPHPELEPLGIRAGAFLVYPELSVESGFTNNVFGASVGKKSDTYIDLAPAISARSGWSRHMAYFYAKGDFKRYTSNPIKNENGYNVGFESRADLAGQSNVFTSFKANRIYLTQYSGDFPQNAAGSVPLDRIAATVRGTYDRSRIRLIGSVDVNKLNFVDTKSLSGGQIDQDYLDHTTTRISGRAEYRVAPGTVAFVQTTFAFHNYASSNILLNRSGSEIRVLGGAAFNITPLIRSRIGVGYLSRRYDDPAIKALKGIAFDAQFSYLVTPLTTISLGGQREVRDANLANSAGYKATVVQARVDHELLRNLVLYARADGEKDSFSSIDRRDNLFRIGTGATYKPFRNIVVEPTVDFVKRNSKGTNSTQSFDEFRFAINAVFRL